MKLTKIIATIGPACEREDIIEELISYGVNIFRFNFKHNTVEWHEEQIRKVKKISKKLGIPTGTLIDLQGPEIRINMKKDEIQIEKEKTYIFEKDIPTTHPQILNYLKQDQMVVADDGAFKFVVQKAGKTVYLKALSSGLLKNKKTITVPGADFPVSLLVDRDLEGIRLAGQEKIDFIALSFVRTADDINFLREELKKLNVHSKIVSKLETQRAIDNLDAIIKVSDVVMVARGDLGVELPLEQVPYYQKKIIKKCIVQGVPVITATQMLESMVQNPYPTRAEVSDVANAVYDLTDSLMLSAESAIGSYPSKAVETMAQTSKFTEKKQTEDTRIQHDYDIDNQIELVCDAAYNLYHKSGGEDVIEAFIVFTESGKTAQTISRYRPKVPIFAFVPSEEVATRLSINFGIVPIVHKKKDIEHATQFLVVKNYLYSGKKVIVISADNWGELEPVSTIRVVKV